MKIETFTKPLQLLQTEETDTVQPLQASLEPPEKISQPAKLTKLTKLTRISRRHPYPSISCV